MYVFQFCDGTWRLARMTNTAFPLPVKGEARVLFEAVYKNEASAYIGKEAVRALHKTNPELFVACAGV